MSKKFKFDLTDTWYMHKSASALENDTHKLLWDFDIQTDHLISARRADLIIINEKKKKKKKTQKRTYKIAVSAAHWIQLKESEKKDKYLLGNWKKKTMEHEGDIYTNRNWGFLYSHQRIIKWFGGIRGWRTSGDHPNYSIIENGQNTEKSPGDLRRLAVAQTPVKNHQLKLMWKMLNK